MTERKMKKIVGYVRVDYSAMLGALAAIVKPAPADDAVEIKFEIHELCDGSIVLDCAMQGEREMYEGDATRIGPDRRLSREVWRRLNDQFRGMKLAVDTTDDKTYRIKVAMPSLEQVCGYLRECTIPLRLEVQYEDTCPPC